eukprot:TRINITY_DN19973_c0_g2_i1.p1 TRINITY_DN19973_c0_g2~~TRINITY_DN19973_c0_g2_i1.p1  ORF type:complete len:428 (-),score=38.06 TRINITY_DN19973_c0_g2_i1:108-1391(-)
MRRGPCRPARPAAERKICFDHDPRVGALCAREEECRKRHLNTLDENEASRFDKAWSGWKAAYERFKSAENHAATSPGDDSVSTEKFFEQPPLDRYTSFDIELPEPNGVHDVPWYYNEQWHLKASASKFISVAAYMARTPLWHSMPRLRRYRELDSEELFRFADELGSRLGMYLTSKGEPAILCVEKPYLDGFVSGLHRSMQVPFVLLAVNGGDAPLTRDVQERISSLKHLRACFAMNLHMSISPLFFPLPIGLPHHADGLCRGKLRSIISGETLMTQIKGNALPWKMRDPRLLLTPMGGSRVRDQYRSVLSNPDYEHLVRIIEGRLSFEAFLSVISEHQSTLSLPGKGYDCYRTWQALALGTVPVVFNEARFDARLHGDCCFPVVPPPDELSPEKLDTILSNLSDPIALEERLDIGYWMRVFEAHLE